MSILRGIEVNSEAFIPRSDTTQKTKFSIKDFFSKYDQIGSFLWICSHLLKKYVMENLIFYAVRNLETIANLIPLKIADNKR